jgi:hypothetical protein
MRSCKLCGGGLFLLGQLGCLLWFRCRSCGMEFNKRRRTDECDYLDLEDNE